MITLIYRKSDRVVAGMVKPPHGVGVEIQNILGSELGGVADDYDTVEVDSDAPQGNEWVINSAGVPTVQVIPAFVERANARRSGVLKLIALGLNEAEIKAMGLPDR